MTENEFVNEFNAIRPENFTDRGLRELYNYFNEYEDSCDTTIEFDPIAICCEYSEDSIENVLDDYKDTINDIEDLQNHTIVVGVWDDMVLYLDF
jgi:hypothetical protein